MDDNAYAKFELFRLIVSKAYNLDMSTPIVRDYHAKTQRISVSIYGATINTSVGNLISTIEQASPGLHL